MATNWAIAIIAVAQIYCWSRAYGIVNDNALRHLRRDARGRTLLNLWLLLCGDDRRRAEWCDAQHLSSRNRDLRQRELAILGRALARLIQLDLVADVHTISLRDVEHDVV